MNTWFTAGFEPAILIAQENRFTDDNPHQAARVRVLLSSEAGKWGGISQFGSCSIH
jgi:hypothetical protein